MKRARNDEERSNVADREAVCNIAPPTHPSPLHVPYLGRDGLALARLVCGHGFTCIMDAECMAKSLGTKFYDWFLTNIAFNTTAVGSVGAERAMDCTHYVTIGVSTWRTEILERRPNRWYHLLHIPMDRRAPLLDLRHVAVTMLHDDEPIAQALLIFDGKLITGVCKNDITGRLTRVDHSQHTEDQFRFLVEVKWK